MRKIKFLLFIISILANSLFAQFDFEAVQSKAFLEAFSSFDNVYQGSEVKLAFKVTIAEEWHVNSNDPGDEFLIPTAIEIADNPNFELVSIIYPEAEKKNLSFQEEPLELYEGTIYIGAVLKVKDGVEPGEYSVSYSFTYQACKEQCMPPETIDGEIKINIVNSQTPVNQINSEVFSNIKFTATEKIESDDNDDSLAGTLESSGLFISILVVFLGGLALNLTPCVYPLIPITIGYFGGQSEGSTGKLFGLGIFYVLGIALTYSIVGVVTSLSGSVFGTLMQNPVVVIVVAAVLVALSLSMFGLYEFKMPDKWVMKAGGAKSGVFGAFFMGLTMGIVAAPCIGPFVLGLVTYVGAKGDPVYGFFMFFFLALGLGTPYLFLALFSGKIKNLPRAGFWMEAVKHIFGFVLIGMAIYFLLPLIPKSINGFILPVYMIGVGIYLGFIDKLANDVKGFRIFKIVFSIVLIALSAWMLWPVEKKSPDWQKFTLPAYEKSIDSGEMMIIDFYADWCIPCKELDAMTFSDQRVIDESKKYTSYKVDMTKTLSEENEKIRKKFNIVGMPTIIIIDSNGNERERLTGFVDADKFLEILGKAK